MGNPKKGKKHGWHTPPIAGPRPWARPRGPFIGLGPSYGKTTEGPTNIDTPFSGYRGLLLFSILLAFTYGALILAERLFDSIQLLNLLTREPFTVFLMLGSASVFIFAIQLTREKNREKRIESTISEPVTELEDPFCETDSIRPKTAFRGILTKEEIESLKSLSKESIDDLMLDRFGIISDAEEIAAINEKIAAINEETVERIKLMSEKMSKWATQTRESLHDLEEKNRQVAYSFIGHQGEGKSAISYKLERVLNSPEDIKAILRAGGHVRIYDIDSEQFIDLDTVRERYKDEKKKGFIDVNFLLYFVPALIAVGFSFTMLFLFIVNAEKDGYETPDSLTNSVTTILGYYFGIATSERHAKAKAAKQSEAPSE